MTRGKPSAGQQIDPFFTVAELEDRQVRAEHTLQASNWAMRRPARDRRADLLAALPMAC